MNKVITANWERIHISEARRRFVQGLPVYAMAHKLDPDGFWESPNQLNTESPTAFNSVINAATYHNCNYRTGRYLAYYIKRGD